MKVLAGMMCVCEPGMLDVRDELPKDVHCWLVPLQGAGPGCGHIWM